MKLPLRFGAIDVTAKPATSYNKLVLVGSAIVVAILIFWPA